MPSKKLTLHIPEPCHEDWATMLPDQKGRHCLACQKTVVDFTQLSDKEIIDFFATKPASVCGRFRSDQLNTRLIEHPQPAPRWKLYLLAFTATMTMKTILSETTNAQAPAEQKELKILRSIQGEMGLVASSVASDTTVFTISGKVTDSTSHEGLEGVAVFIKGTKTATTTDAAGKFRLSNVKRGDVLVFSYIGYEVAEVIPYSEQPLRITLSPSVEALTGEIVIVQKYALHKRIFHRIKSWF